jgi:hypothetical protein
MTKSIDSKFYKKYLERHKLYKIKEAKHDKRHKLYKIKEAKHDKKHKR